MGVAIAGATPAVAKLLRAINSAPDREAEEGAIAEALLVWGRGALPVLTPLVGDQTGVYVALLRGEIQTGRADEGLRRVELCRQVLDGHRHLHELPLELRVFASEGIIQLSNGTSGVIRTDERSRAIDILRTVVEGAGDSGRPDLEVIALSSLLIYGCIHGREASEASQRLARLQRGITDETLQGVARLGQFYDTLVRTGESGTPESLDALERIALEVASSSVLARPGDSVAALAAALRLHASGRMASARQLLGMVVEKADGSSLLGRMLRADAAIPLAQSLLGAGDTVSAIATIEPSVSFLEDQYCGAVTLDDIAEAKEHLAAAGEALFEGYARLEDYSALFVLADRLTGLRSRERAALRLSAGGRTVLQVEREMFVAARGATAPIGDPRSDQFASAIPALDSLREQLRALRDDVRPERSSSPTPVELARTLSPEEAVLVLAVSDERTVVFLVGGSDGEQERVRSWDLGAWPERRWFDLLEDWLIVLIAGTPEASELDAILDRVDSVLGPAICETAEMWHICRLYLVAHRGLGTLPLWALPSLRSVDVVVADSVAAIVDQHHREPAVLGDQALLVVNPTEDLTVAAAQLSDVCTQLTSHGFGVVSLAGARASAAEVREALREAGIFHYVGHGKRDVLRPEKSALLVAPRPDPMWSKVGPLLDLFVDGWETEGDGGRSRVVDGIGRVTEWSCADVDVDRRVETNFETYFGRWRDGDVVFAAELLSAEDVASGAGLARCAVAVLMACETGPVDVGTLIVGEPGRLAAAFHQAGAPTVVATGWPIRETTSMVFSSLLYEQLLDAGSVVDVGHAVRIASSRLREMGRDDAAGRIRVHGSSTHGSQAFRLRALAQQIADGVLLPFADPVAWAAFFVTGSPTIAWSASKAAEGGRHR